ncbi:hypothetical protein LCGC14_0861760 [marine sediment metagenome]|uniref:Uncharacterized protein n=1 Tax=marine sediment metagenome TaxID=412755 RepID=A0A0F9P729_9ZZZZ
MKKILIATTLLFSLSFATACYAEETPQLIYHGEITTLRPLETGIFGSKAIIITPDTQITIQSPAIGFYADGNIMPITEWDKWFGDIKEITKEISGVYFVYHRLGKSGFNTIFSLEKVDVWNNSRLLSQH